MEHIKSAQRGGQKDGTAARAGRQAGKKQLFVEKGRAIRAAIVATCDWIGCRDDDSSRAVVIGKCSKEALRSRLQDPATSRQGSGRIEGMS